jgi:hypothetical protein
MQMTIRMLSVLCLALIVGCSSSPWQNQPFAQRKDGALAPSFD